MSTATRNFFDVVFFDFSGTLFEVEAPRTWLRRAARIAGAVISANDEERLASALVAAGRPGGPDPRALPTALVELYARRDLSAADHRSAYTALLNQVELPNTNLVEVLYSRTFDPTAWTPYPEVASVLGKLRSRGVKTAVISNIVWDIRPTFAAHGMADLVDSFFLSFETGYAKPDREIFRMACDEMGVSPSRALMVGDHAADAGALQTGVMTLLIPRKPPGCVNGLSAVVSLVSCA